MEHNIEVQAERQDKGFTLVELLIVIVILGILATVTVFAVRGITNQGQDSACEADLKTIQVAAEAFMAQEGRYPANLAEMETEGFLRDSSSQNWTYTHVPAAGATPENFTVVATTGGPCV
jgi:general secretion pathway protein G